jgi:hypothetical protein
MVAFDVKRVSVIGKLPSGGRIVGLQAEQRSADRQFEVFGKKYEFMPLKAEAVVQDGYNLSIVRGAVIESPDGSALFLPEVADNGGEIPEYRIKRPLSFPEKIIPNEPALPEFDLSSNLFPDLSGRIQFNKSFYPLANDFDFIPKARGDSDPEPPRTEPKLPTDTLSSGLCKFPASVIRYGRFQLPPLEALGEPAGFVRWLVSGSTIKNPDRK